MGADGQASDTAGIRVPPPLFFVGAFAAGVALELAFPLAAPPLAVRIAAGVAGLVAWLVLDGAATLSFRRAGTSPIPFKPSTELVTDGPYRWSRNPMYLGMALLHAGLAVAFAVIWALILLPLAVLAVDRHAIAREEPYLEHRFGDAYRDYRGRVRRWI